MKRQYGLIGYPLSHSFSKSYFLNKFEKENINAEYINFPMENLVDIKSIAAKYPQLNGLNVTIPYKQEIISQLDYINPIAEKIGAINTIKVYRKDNSIKLIGFNTDAPGFSDTLPKLNKNKSAIILGTGGASLAVKFALKEKGINCIMVSRSKKKNCINYSQINKELLMSCELIINTTPIGMSPNTNEKPKIPYTSLQPHNILYDLIYNPKKTLFLKEGEQRNCKTFNGLQMLINQAELSYNIWTKEDLNY
ncbi:MAG: shikimate dehydrogenase [Bacteroidales bacterium]